MFKVHIQNKLLLRMPVMGTGTGLRRFLCPGQVSVSVCLVKLFIVVKLV